jgi:hypothetical protein
MKALHGVSLTKGSAGIARRRFSPVEYLDVSRPAFAGGCFA